MDVCWTIIICLLLVIMCVDSAITGYFKYRINYDNGITSNLNKQIEFNKWKIKMQKGDK